MSRARKRKRKQTSRSGVAAAPQATAVPLVGGRQATGWGAGVLVLACFVVGIGGGIYLKQRRSTNHPSGTEVTAGKAALVGENAGPQSMDGDDVQDVADPQAFANDGPAPTDARSSPRAGGPAAGDQPPAAALQPPANTAERARIERQFGQLFRSGYQKFQEERFAEANKDFARAVQVAPYLAEGHYFLGETYRKLMLPAKAEQSFRAALRQMPDFKDAQEPLAILLYERGGYNEALELLAEMARQRPQDPFVLAEQGINYLALGDAERARDKLTQYNQLQGPQAWGLANLGRAHEALGEVERARELYESAIKTDPYYNMAYHWLALLLARSGEVERSQPLFERYDRLRTLETVEHQMRVRLNDNPRDIAALLQQAQARWELGKHQLARQTLQRARQLSPNHPGVLQLSREFAPSDAAP